MKHNALYPARTLTKQDPKGKEFADQRLKAALADALGRGHEPPQPTRKRLVGELHVLELQIRLLLKERSARKQQLDHFD